MFRYFTSPAFWKCVLFGATIGAFLDYLHTHGDEIRYPEGTNHWRGILTFATVYSLGAVAFAKFNVIFKNKKTPPTYQESLPQLGIWCLMYAFTAYGDLPTGYTAFVLIFVGLMQWKMVEGGTTQTLVGSIVTGCGGALIEGWLSHVGGTMTYVQEDICFVPYWLPALYFSSGMSWGQISRRAFLECEEQFAQELVGKNTLPLESAVNVKDLSGVCFSPFSTTLTLPCSPTKPITPCSPKQKVGDGSFSPSASCTGGGGGGGGSGGPSSPTSPNRKTSRHFLQPLLSPTVVS